MKTKKIISAVVSAALMLSPCTSFSMSAANADTTYTVTFLDFDGNVLFTQKVGAGGNIDYSFIDTSTLHRHVDAYTEQEFCGWSSTPTAVNSDLTIQALARTAVISLNSVPTTTRYFSKSGAVSTDGLSVTITITTELPEFTIEGEYKTEVSVVDITNTCTVKPSALYEAFANGDTAQVRIYPINAAQPIYTYTITNYDYLGDADSDGKADGIDASLVLTAYCRLAANQGYELDEDFIRRADVNFDGIVDARDASAILRYYAVSSTVSGATWENVIDFD